MPSGERDHEWYIEIRDLVRVWLLTKVFNAASRAQMDVNDRILPYRYGLLSLSESSRIVTRIIITRMTVVRRISVDTPDIRISLVGINNVSDD